MVMVVILGDDAVADVLAVTTPPATIAMLAKIKAAPSPPKRAFPMGKRYPFSALSAGSTPLPTCHEKSPGPPVV